MARLQFDQPEAAEGRGQVQADDPLEEVLPRLRETGASVSPVYADGRLVGLLTMENIGELMMIRSAVNQAAAAS